MTRPKGIPALTTNCPHCGTSVDHGNYSRHERVCARNPTVREAILCSMRDPQNPAHAISAERYNQRRVMYGAPSDKTLVNQYDGTWRTVYEDFGLLRPLIYDRNLSKVVCEHCAQEFASGLYDRHAPLCPKDPVHYAAIRAALQSAEYPEFAVPILEYAERAKATGVAGVDMLKRTFGGWTAAVRYFGLEPANSEELQERREMDKVLATARLEARLLREDAAAAQWLFVGDDDPCKPNYKPPIVYTDFVPPGYVRVVLR